MNPDYAAVATFVDPTDRAVVVVLNYNTAADTLECLASLHRHCPVKIVLLDNGSMPHEVAALRAYAAYRDNILLLANPTNLGFAVAHNRIFAALLDRTAVPSVILLNSDTVVDSDVVAGLCAVVDLTSADMVAGRMRQYDRDEVESLGVCFYKSGLASNRKSLNEPLLGPTGGCALYSRRLLETLRIAHGECFDEAFFCYAEDTDLAWRARLLGFNAALADHVAIRHKLSRSSGGRNSEFVLYHGIRNSLLTLAKNWPAGLLLRCAPWIALMLGSVLLRHWRWRELKIVLRAYRDAVRRMPLMLAKRRRIQATRQRSASQCRQWLSRRFYDPAIIGASLRALLPGKI